MSESIGGLPLLTVKAETCGACRFGHLIDIGVTECRGLPPTPVMVGMTQNLAGQGEPAIALMRPRLAPTQAGCALWKPKTLESAIMAGNG